jgi:hypothetical protein
MLLPLLLLQTSSIMGACQCLQMAAVPVPWLIGSGCDMLQAMRASWRR